MNTTDDMLKDTEFQSEIFEGEPEDTVTVTEEALLEYFVGTENAADEENDITDDADAGSEFDFDMDFSDLEEEEAREARKEAKKEEKKAAKQQKKQKKNVWGLTLRILGIVMVPIYVLSIFYIADSVSSAKKLTHRLVYGEMEGLTISAVEAFTLFAHGDYSYADGVFYKGTTDMEPMYEYLDDMGEKADVDVMVYLGDTCVMTTHTDESGARLADEKMDAEIYDIVMAGNFYYNSKTEFQGGSYAVYYYPLMQESTGEVVGAVFCGLNREGIDSDMNGVLAKLIVIGLLIAVAAAVFAIYSVVHIVKAVKQNIANLTEVADGKLVVRVSEETVKRGDEIGDIARSVKKLVEELKVIVGSIQNSTKEVSDFSDLMHESMGKIGDTVESVNLAVEEIAKGATSQATETMQANMQVAQIGEAIEVAVTEVENLGISAKKMDEYSIDADKTLQELLIISKEADDAITEIKKQTNETNRSAQKIQKATDMITAIASQTNLLSLNASIEAARAGEAGKGFAVVVDEIRQLAEQSRASAEEIRVIVEALIMNSNTSVKTMNEVSESINTQNDKLDETLKVFSELSSEVTSVMGAIKGISGQTKVLADLREGVVSIVEGLAAVAEENAASAQETSASMYEVGMIVQECAKQTEQLLALKKELEDDIAMFSIPEDTAEQIVEDAETVVTETIEEEAAATVEFEEAPVEEFSDEE